MSSYAGKLLRVNLSNGQIKAEQIPEEIYRAFMGARGIGIKYLYDELKPGIDPLGPENKLFLGAATLGGTTGQGFSRWLAMTKSPVSGGIGRAVGGANFAARLKASGFDAIIIEGQAKQPCYIYVEDGKAEILDAAGLWGLNTEETQEKLKQKHGAEIAAACIGPAGEQLVRYAAIASDRRTASRCGVGTVMGSKKLKAVAATGTWRATPHNPGTFKTLSKELVEILKSDPRRLRLTDVGTSGSVDTYTAKMYVTPHRNFQEGSMEGDDKLLSPEFKKTKVGNFGCWGCMTRCGQVREVTEGPYAGVWSEGPEYESIFAFGCNLCNTDIGSMVAADALCDLYGIDTISTGVCIAFACELFDRGIISIKDTDGLDLTWGNHAAFVSLVEKIGKREGFGRLLGEGVKRAAEQIGQGAERYAMHAKGIELPGYEPRAVKGYALSYAVANIGGSHMYARPSKELSLAVDPLADEGKGAMIAEVQRGQALNDCIMVCPFGSSGLTPELRNQLVVAGTGIEEFGDPASLDKVGERIVTLDRAFNVREGFSRKDDTLPSRFLTEPLKNAGPATGETVRKLDTLLDEFYQAMGYTSEGIPSAQRLHELGLDSVAKDLEKFLK